YPYGDYDRRVRESVGKAGYEAALTCEYGRVKRGSDPMRMKRVAIEKSMDFALFRHLLGAGNLRLEEMSPQPGRVLDDPAALVTGDRRVTAPAWMNHPLTASAGTQR